MFTTRPTDNPAPLVVAASLTAVEGLLLVLYAVLEIASTDSSRFAMGATTALFFLVYGVALIAFAWLVTQGRSWARSPLVLAQFIQLGVAWSFRGGGTTAVALVIALVAVIVLAGILHPASIDALSDDPTKHSS